MEMGRCSGMQHQESCPDNDAVTTERQTGMHMQQRDDLVKGLQLRPYRPSAACMTLSLLVMTAPLSETGFVVLRTTAIAQTRRSMPIIAREHQWTCCCLQRCPG